MPLYAQFRFGLEVRSSLSGDSVSSDPSLCMLQLYYKASDGVIGVCEFFELGSTDDVTMLVSASDIPDDGKFALGLCRVTDEIRVGGNCRAKQDYEGEVENGYLHLSSGD